MGVAMETDTIVVVAREEEGMGPTINNGGCELL